MVRPDRLLRLLLDRLITSTFLSLIPSIFMMALFILLAKFILMHFLSDPKSNPKDVKPRELKSLSIHPVVLFEDASEF